MENLTKNKPTLIMCPGTGWSGTSPLYYTLGDYNRYCHCGHLKENKYLEHIYHYNKGDFYTLDKKKVTFRRVMHEIFRDNEGEEKFMEFGLRNRPAQVMYTSGANSHWDKEFVNDFFTQPHTWEKYINYYKKHWEAVVQNGEYKAVSDFSVNNIYFPEEYVQEIARELQPHFNVKILITCRDPVRRAWSKNQFRWFQRKKRGICKDPYHLFWKSISGCFKEGGQVHLCGYGMDILTLYTEGYRRWSEAFGKENVHIFAMEDLWERDGEKYGGKEAMAKLSEFLDYEITEMFPNVYVPEMGSNAPKLPLLSDQWMSDQLDLSHDQQQCARAIMNKSYTEWEKVFGYIPKQWIKHEDVDIPQLTEMTLEEISENLREVMKIDPGCLPTSKEGKEQLEKKLFHT